MRCWLSRLKRIIDFEFSSLRQRLRLITQIKYLTLWIIERRMYQARQLLLDTERSITQIGTDTGYVDTGYFIRQFK